MGAPIQDDLDLSFTKFEKIIMSWLPKQMNAVRQIKSNNFLRKEVVSKNERFFSPVT